MAWSQSRQRRVHCLLPSVSLMAPQGQGALQQSTAQEAVRAKHLCPFEAKKHHMDTMLSLGLHLPVSEAAREGSAGFRVM